MKDYYRILDLPVDASSEAVKDRYRLLVRIFHPDRYPKPEDKAYAEQRLQEINEAYETIQGKRARGLALATDTRPPMPVADPVQVNFGKVVHGDRVQAQIQVDNVGGVAQSLNFEYEENVDWITVVNGQRLDPDRPLPMVLTLEAATESLAIGQDYESWLIVNMNGVDARVPLMMSVVAHPAPGGRVGWMLTLAVALLLAFLLYVGWQWVDTDNLPSTTVALDAVDADVPIVAEGAVQIVEETPALDDVTVAATLPDNAGTGGGTVTLTAANAAPAVVAQTIVTVTQEISTPVPTISEPSPATATVEPTRTPTNTPSFTPTPSLTPIPSPTPTATGLAANAEAISIAPTPGLLPSAPPRRPTASEPVPGSAVVLTVPQSFDVNARAGTSVESAALALLPKGTAYRGIARTIDNAWTQIVLPDGRTAWVFTETMEADTQQVATLPISLDLVDVADVAERPSLEVIPDPAGTAVLDSPGEIAQDDVSQAQVAQGEPSLQSTAAPIVDQQTHFVQPGEYLKQLAEIYYGDERLWEQIYEANLQVIGPDPNQLEAGIELLIPVQ